MLDAMKNKTCVSSNIHKHNNHMIAVQGLTYIDGPYLQAGLLADISKCVLIVITHHSAELKQKDMLCKFISGFVQ